MSEAKSEVALSELLADLPMGKDAAIHTMRNGEKVTHRLFSPEEWMTEHSFGYEFEDGRICPVAEFWEYRQGLEWEGGWKIYS